jgi:hypothetical protein
MDTIGRIEIEPAEDCPIVRRNILTVQDPDRRNALGEEAMTFIRSVGIGQMQRLVPRYGLPQTITIFLRQT